MPVIVTVIVACFLVSVMTGSKRASDDGQDVEENADGHPMKKPRQESDVRAELKILLPSKVFIQ